MMDSMINLMTSSLLVGEIAARAWYAVPLILVVSLVHGATRHEYLKEIFIHSIRSLIWVVGFMAAIFAVIWVAGYWN